MKKLIILIFSLFPMLFIMGCSQVAQLNERLIVQGVGVDYNNSSKEYEVTLQVLNVKGNSESSSDTPKEVEVIKNSGRTVMEAISNIREKNGKEPLFSQTLVVVIGSSAAKNGLNYFMDFFTRNYEFSPLIEILIAENKASDILTLEKDETVMSAENILAISKISSNKSKSFNSNIGNLVSDFKNEYLHAKVLYANIAEKDGQKELNINRLAIIKEDKLFDVLDEDLTKGFLLIKAKTKGVADVIHNEKLSNITYSVVDSKSKIEINEKDKLEIRLPIKAEVKVLETDETMNNEDYQDIKEAIKARFQEVSHRVIERAILQDEADIFGFSIAYLNKNFMHNKKSPEEVRVALKNAEYKIDVTVEIESDK